MEYLERTPHREPQARLKLSSCGEVFGVVSVFGALLNED